MMMGLATLTAEGAAAVLFYLVAYLVHEPRSLSPSSPSCAT